MWEHIPRLVVKGREVIYKQDLLLSGTALLKVVKWSQTWKDWYPETKLLWELFRWWRDRFDPIFCEAVQSSRVKTVAVLTSTYPDKSSSRCLTWKVSQRQAASGLVSAVMGPSLWKGAQVRILFHRMDAGQSWADYQARDLGIRNS